MTGETDLAAGADAVVVAAGSSRRMGGPDKVTAVVGGRPMLAWTLGALAGARTIERIVVVVAPARLPELADATWLPGRVTAVVAGGSTRQASVAAGVRHLDRLDPDGRARPVLVHDGARPLASPDLIDAVARATAIHGAVVPVLPIADTIKRVTDGQVHETVDRAGLGAAQTPQGVTRAVLLDAWHRFPPDRPPEFTDEAALLEACRIPVHAIPGEPANFKVTVSDDLARVDRALDLDPPRIGFGHDSHPFGPGRPLRLGGLELDDVPRLAGHSDGDVVLHAVADALLGAAGLGDLGQLFPADARTPVGMPSTSMLAEVVDRLRAAGLRPGSVDIVVIGARPRLGDRLGAMRGSIAGWLGIDPGAVNVKASSGNLAGDEGAGRSISARAVVTVRSSR